MHSPLHLYYTAYKKYSMTNEVLLNHIESDTTIKKNIRKALLNNRLIYVGW